MKIQEQSEISDLRQGDLAFWIQDPESDPDHHQNLMGTSSDQDAPVYQFSRRSDHASGVILLTDKYINADENITSFAEVINKQINI